METDLLLNDPALFLKSFFTHGYAIRGGLFDSSDSYWNDLKDNVVIKLWALINIPANKEYYASIPYFNIVFLLGQMAFHKALANHAKVAPVWFFGFVFLMPSFLFWCSGPHKDGLVFAAIGVIVFVFDRWIAANRPGIVDGFLFFGAFSALFAIKNYMALLLVPCLFAWWLSVRAQLSVFWAFAGVFAAGAVLVTIVASLFPCADPLVFLSRKQNSFLLLKGNSAINVPPLRPTLASVAAYFPTAIDIGLFRPKLNELKGPAYWMAYLETIVYQTLAISLFFFRKQLERVPAIFAACFVFGMCVLLLDGYTVTFIGAMVRYRGIVLPLIVGPLVAFLPIGLGRFAKKR